MGPGRDWSFINALASKIRARHRPARDKSNLRLSDELLDLGLRLITAAAEQEGLRAAVLHRDGLMSALLALAPLRRRNFAALRLGENRVETNGSWIILLEGAETKTHAEHEIMWPQELFGPLLESPEFRQAYARLLVDEVTVSDEAIRISGRKTCWRVALPARQI